MLKKIDGFILALFTAIFMAWIIPVHGKAEHIVDLVSDIGVSLIFFFYGLKLSPKQMKEGLSNVRLHLLVQITTFLVFPLLLIAILPLIDSQDAHQMWLAIFFLAALPSTVSSSVVMVVLAKGNVPGAIFNASLSGLIGILLTPLWMGLFMNTGNGSFDFSNILLDLLLKILVPVIAGLLLHRFFGDFARKHSKQLARFDKTIILLIVYKSFSHSFSTGLFNNFSLLELGGLSIAVALLFLLVYNLVSILAKWQGFSREDRITALFCGSKKSLVHGTVMASVLFEGMPGQGLYLLPIMLYHALQLVIISIIAQRMARTATL